MVGLPTFLLFSFSFLVHCFRESGSASTTWAKAQVADSDRPSIHHSVRSAQAVVKQVTFLEPRPPHRAAC